MSFQPPAVAASIRTAHASLPLLRMRAAEAIAIGMPLGQPSSEAPPQPACALPPSSPPLEESHKVLLLIEALEKTPYPLLIKYVKGAPSGLRWTDEGASFRPREWIHRKLEHRELAEALATKSRSMNSIQFSQSEWDAFNIAALTENDYIEGGGTVYKPYNVAHVDTSDFRDAICARVGTYATFNSVPLPVDMLMDRTWTMGLLSHKDRNIFVTSRLNPYDTRPWRPTWAADDFVQARRKMYCVQTDAVIWPFRIKGVKGIDELLNVQGPVEHKLCYMSMDLLIADVCHPRFPTRYDCHGCFARPFERRTLACTFTSSDDTITLRKQKFTLPGRTEPSEDMFEIAEPTAVADWLAAFELITQAYYDSRGRGSTWYQAWQLSLSSAYLGPSSATLHTITCFRGFDTGSYNYVIIPNGDLLMDKSDVNHSVLCCGVPVICAGKLRWTGTAVSYIDNDSGHYRPPRTQLDEAIRILHRARLLGPQGYQLDLSAEAEVLRIADAGGLCAWPKGPEQALPKEPYVMDW